MPLRQLGTAQWQSWFDWLHSMEAVGADGERPIVVLKDPLTLPAPAP